MVLYAIFVHYANSQPRYCSCSLLARASSSASWASTKLETKFHDTILNFKLRQPAQEDSPPKLQERAGQPERLLRTVPGPSTIAMDVIDLSVGWNTVKESERRALCHFSGKTTNLCPPALHVAWLPQQRLHGPHCGPPAQLPVAVQLPQKA